MITAGAFLEKVAIDDRDTGAFLTTGVQGVMAKRDKEKGKNHIGKHAVGGALFGAGAGAASMAKGAKGKGALIGAAIGGSVSAARYGAGRLWGKDKKKKQLKKK